MATLNQVLTSVWVNVTSAQSLAANTTYNFQALGGEARVAESSAAPTVIGRRYRDGEKFPYTASSSENMWAKGSGLLVIDIG